MHPIAFTLPEWQRDATYLTHKQIPASQMIPDAQCSGKLPQVATTTLTIYKGIRKVAMIIPVFKMNVGIILLSLKMALMHRTMAHSLSKGCYESESETKVKLGRLV